MAGTVAVHNMVLVTNPCGDMEEELKCNMVLLAIP